MVSQIVEAEAVNLSSPQQRLPGLLGVVDLKQATRPLALSPLPRQDVQGLRVQRDVVLVAVLNASRLTVRTRRSTSMSHHSKDSSSPRRRPVFIAIRVIGVR